jgi:hypothetical protein
MRNSYPIESAEMCSSSSSFEENASVGNYGESSNDHAHSSSKIVRNTFVSLLRSVIRRDACKASLVTAKRCRSKLTVHRIAQNGL